MKVTEGLRKFGLRLLCLIGWHDDARTSIQTPQGELLYVSCKRCPLVGRGWLLDRGEKLPAEAVRRVIELTERSKQYPELNPWLKGNMSP